MVNGTPGNEKLAYGIKQIMELVPVSRGTVFNEIRIGNLKVFHCGRRTLTTWQAIEDWIELLKANQQYKPH